MGGYENKTSNDALEGFEDIQIIRPGTRYYIKLLESGELFAFNKRTHGFWDLLVQLKRIDQQVGESRRSAVGKVMGWLRGASLGGRERRRKILLAEKEEVSRYKSFWVGNFSGELIKDLQRFSRYPLVMEGISFRGHSGTGMHTKGVDAAFTKEELRDALSHYVPRQPIWHDALVWKDAIITGEFRELIDAIRPMGVVVVGPAHLESLGRLWNLPHFSHIAIHATNAIGDRERILERIVTALEMDGGRRSVCLIQAGVLAFWLAYRLMDRGVKSSLIDLGRVLDVWYPQIVGSQPWFRTVKESVISRMGLEGLYK